MYAASKYLYINCINISHFIDIIFYLSNVDRFLGQILNSIYQKQVVFTHFAIRKYYRKRGISYFYCTLIHFRIVCQSQKAIQNLLSK